jgi:hypothetical protein
MKINQIRLSKRHRLIPIRGGFVCRYKNAVSVTLPQLEIAKHCSNAERLSHLCPVMTGINRLNFIFSRRETFSISIARCSH